MRPAFANVRFEWESAAARIAAAPAADRRALEAGVQRTVTELRRRLGGPFDISELIDLWAEGTDWVLERAVDAAPGHPRAWDQETVAGAAFWRYARGASDFAGGRRQGVE